MQRSKQSIRFCNSFMHFGMLWPMRTEKAIKSAHNYNMNAQKELMTEIKTNRNKIHFRYFNLTRSLEEIHNVKIDTKNGKLEK